MFTFSVTDSVTDCCHRSVTGLPGGHEFSVTNFLSQISDTNFITFGRAHAWRPARGSQHVARVADASERELLHAKSCSRG